MTNGDELIAMRGQPLPCCGCKFDVGRHAEVCACRCHFVHRHIYAIPEAGES